MISVIVPIYNTERYLRRCVDSIINQTYKDLEIILVNDGSTDNCPQICDEYKEKDNRIRVIHQENKGLSGARNTGIENARGEELAFIDSDDCIHTTMMDVLHGLLIEEQADIAACGYYWIEEGECDKTTQTEPVTKKTYNKDVHAFLFDRPDLAVIACNKLYERKLFDKVKYPEGRYHEDEFVIHHLLGECGRVTFTTEKLYYYYVHDDSITRTPNPSKIMDTIDALDDRVDYYHINGLFDYYEKSGRIWIGSILDNYQKALLMKDCTDLDSLLMQLRNRLNSRLHSFRMEKVINNRYCFICHIWTITPKVGAKLLNAYHKLHMFKEKRKDCL